MHVLLRSRSNTRCSAEPPTGRGRSPPLPGSGHRRQELQITVVRDHHGSVHDTGEDVDQQMRGDVDIRPLLFTVSEEIMNVASGTGLPLASCTITSH
jgi:hypothetical protein